MPLSLTTLRSELKNRARVLGAFASSDSADRLDNAIKSALLMIWNRYDWDFKNSTATISTTAGNKGPYTPPSGLVRFATTRRLYTFGYADVDTLTPVQSTDVRDWFLYINEQDGQLYFVNDPGTSTLTLNYVGEFDNDKADLAVTAALFDAGLHEGVLRIAYGDLVSDLPGMLGEADARLQRGMVFVDEYWNDATRDKYQKTIAPKGLNRNPIDSIARQITVLGTTIERFSEDD